ARRARKWFRRSLRFALARTITPLYETGRVHPPNDLRFSCGRLARTVEIYVPLTAIGALHQSEAHADAPVSCKRWLGGTATPMLRHRFDRCRSLRIVTIGPAP